MRTRDADILIIPGLGGSGPGHWQTRWEAKLPTARRVEQADWDRPEQRVWAARIVEAVAAADRPVVMVAHSLGVIAAAHVLTVEAAEKIAGAFLVAPPSQETIAGLPEIAPDFRPYPSAALSCPATLVASATDPYCPLATAKAMAAKWNVAFLNAGDAGHINAESGHGPWPEGLMAFAGFIRTL